MRVCARHRSSAEILSRVVQGARENVQAGNAAVDWNIRSVLWGHSVMDGLTDSGRYGDEVTPIVIQLVLRETSAEPSASLTSTVGRHQATLEPQFPGVDDPALTVYWQVTVNAPEAAELQAELLDLPEVDGAYVKPPEEPA